MVRFISAFAPAFAAGAAWGMWRPQNTVAECATAKSPFTMDEFRAFKLLSCRYESQDTRRLFFGLESTTTPFVIPVISCVVAKVTDKDGKDVMYPLTPITGNNKKGHFEVIVKKTAKDKVSSHLFQMRTGDELLMKGPFQKLAYKPNMWDSVGMLASSTGVAPMYQLLQEILENPKDKTHATLIYANNRREDILLANELKAMQETYKNFNLYLTLVEAPKRWLGGIGRINEAMIQTFMPKPSDKQFTILVAGPPEMLAELAGDKVFEEGKRPHQGPLLGLLKEMGYKEDQVFKL
ncbi:putative cytochrome-b5 reductase [Trypanosoma vivax]|uniref:cytochrome-b5 reductase n=1 Tax=Trypanosoma vivax (strain Y486) TaxID=1055687 RepID=F9WM79_TRYVY|nr:putative cytochrome-b5 reductase [Trypanosoma vivax]CCD18630.1 cytochrome-b5 reductase, putative [Trypanosoma vivax Y486]|eukprot:CCD18630.1 cytochrome-b5 reductase, putative [Trypanosoma vivax Y486]